MKDVINYAENPDKTTSKKYLDEDLYNALRYVENDDKTDKKLFVSAINCPVQRAYEHMMTTKQHYGKLGGISPELRYEIQLLDNRIQQQKFLTNYKIDSSQELFAAIDEIQRQIKELETQRNKISNRIRRAIRICSKRKYRRKNNLNKQKSTYMK